MVVVGKGEVMGGIRVVLTAAEEDLLTSEVAKLHLHQHFHLHLHLALAAGGGPAGGAPRAGGRPQPVPQPPRRHRQVQASGDFFLSVFIVQFISIDTPVLCRDLEDKRADIKAARGSEGMSPRWVPCTYTEVFH